MQNQNVQAVQAQANIFRNVKTGRLVHLYMVTPRQVLGQHIEQEDFYTKEKTVVKRGVTADRNGENLQLDAKFYEAVAYH